MRVLLLALAVLAVAAPYSAAQDYTPRRCNRAQDYSGAPLAILDVGPALAPRRQETRSFDSATVARLEAALVRARQATGARAMSVAIMAPGRGAWNNTPEEQRFYWASVGKAFTAVVVLQLAEEGRLSLGDPISTWVNGVPNGDAVTIRHLLNHTSGLFSANEDRAFREAPHRLDTEETVEILVRHGAMFCPGENWRYSNSGYDLLGAVIERIERRPLGQVITDRVLRRLDGANLRVIERDDALSDIATPAPRDETPAIDPRIPGPAGPIAGDANGMISFLRASLGSELLNAASTRAQFAELFPMFGGPQSYGLGVMAYQLPSDRGGPGAIWVGHSGGAPGVKAVVAYSINDDAFVAVALTGDGSAEATASLLLQQLRTQ